MAKAKPLMPHNGSVTVHFATFFPMEEFLKALDKMPVALKHDLVRVEGYPLAADIDAARKQLVGVSPFARRLMLISHRLTGISRATPASIKAAIATAKKEAAARATAKKNLAAQARAAAKKAGR